MGRTRWGGRGVTHTVKHCLCCCVMGAGKVIMPASFEMLLENTAKMSLQLLWCVVVCNYWMVK